MLKEIATRRCVLTVFIVALQLFVSVAHAVEPEGGQSSERSQLMAAIEKYSKNDIDKQLALNAGKERTLLCSSCHGVDGNSIKPETPNLAGQNPAYIIEQFDKFATGERKNFVMQTLAGSFTFQDKVNLAIYYAEQKVKPEPVKLRTAEKGKDIYQRICFRCHGQNGNGEAGYARLAGQRINYVKMTLKRFRSNALGSVDALDVRRSNANMEQVTAHLSDDDIEGLAHYIAQLK